MLSFQKYKLRTVEQANLPIKCSGFAWSKASPYQSFAQKKRLEPIQQKKLELKDDQQISMINNFHKLIQDNIFRIGETKIHPCRPTTR